MALRILFSAIILFQSQANTNEYVSISDPDRDIQLQPTSWPQPILLATEGRFDRFEITNSYSISFWVLLQTESGEDTTEILNVINGSYCYAWIKEGHGTKQIFVRVGPFDAQSDTSVSLNQFESDFDANWRFVAIAVSEDDDIIRLFVGQYPVGEVVFAESDGNTFEPWDRSVAQFQVGGSFASNNFHDRIHDVRFHNYFLTESAITDLITGMTWHFTCDTCWGPGEWSCLDKTQVSSIYEEITVTTDHHLVYNYDDTIFEHTKDSFTSETSWVGWIHDANASDLNGTWQAAFRTVNERTSPPDPSDQQTINGFYFQADSTGAIESASASFTYEDDGEIDFSESFLFSFPLERYRWIGISFCNDNIILWVHQLDGSLEPTCTPTDLEAGQVPRLWADTGSDNEMILGTVDDVTQEHIFKDVRYFFKGWKSEEELKALYTESKNACKVGCATCTDHLTCETWALGRYADGSDCRLCHRACSNCVGASDMQCSECNSGYYKQNGATICYKDWAFGFTQNGTDNECVGTAGLAFELQFDWTDQIYTTSGIQVQMGLTDEVESSDPQYNNGWMEFGGVDDVLYIGNADAPLTLHTNFTLSMWVRILGELVLSCVVSKLKGSGDTFLQMCVSPVDSQNSTTEVYIKPGSVQHTLADWGQQQPNGEWFIWTLTGQFEDSTTGTTFYNFANLELLAQETEAGDFLIDDGANAWKLGVGTVWTGVALVDGNFLGSIYSFKLYTNYQNVGDQGEYATTLGCPAECSTICFPVLACIVTCPAAQYDNRGTWEDCHTTWTHCTDGDACVSVPDLSDDEDTSNEADEGTSTGDSNTSEDTSTDDSNTTEDTNTQDDSSCAAPNFTVEDDAAACVSACPSSYYQNNSSRLCQPCLTQSCQTCSSVTTCTQCAIGYLIPEGTCESACPSNYYANIDNVCQPCAETWVTCSGIGVQDCVSCIDGWVRRNGATDSSDCLCNIPILENTTASLQVACMNAPLSQTPLPQSSQLDIIEEIANEPNLTTEGLEAALGATDNIQFESVTERSEFNEMLNDAAVVGLQNSGQNQFSYSGSEMEVYLESGTAGDFVNAELLTEKGSGLRLSSLDDVLQRDEPVQINVFSYNNEVSETNDTLIDTVLSIEAFYLDNGIGTELVLTNLTNNVTIVFDELNLNTTLTYQCVYLLPNYTWSTDGCYLSSIAGKAAECSCNHLSEFSMRGFFASAEVDTNIASTVDLENLENFDINNSYAPLICLGIIYTIYAGLLFAFLRLDKVDDKIAVINMVKQTSIRGFNINASVRAITLMNQAALVSEAGSQQYSANDQNQSQEQSPGHFKSHSQLIQSSSIASHEVIGRENTSRDSASEIGTPQDSYSEIGTPRDDKQIFPMDTIRSTEVVSHQTLPDDKSPISEPDSEPNAEDEKPKFKSMFLEKHEVFGMLFQKHGPLRRAEKLTIILVLLMLELFSIGLFYDNDRNPDEEETEDDKTVEQSFDAFGWKDFWIMIYTLLIIIPVPIILKKLFTRKDLDPKLTLEQQIKGMKKQRTLRIIAYIICFLVCTWCTWSIIMFSIDFGHNTSQIWLINFGITTITDIFVKDLAVALLMVSIGLYLPMIKEKLKKRNAECKVEPIAEVAEDSARTKLEYSTPNIK